MKAHLAVALSLVLAATATPARAEPKVLFRERERSERGGAGTPLLVTGSIVAGLGLTMVFASGITWTVAAAEASRLDEECPNKKCVIGSRGADALETARDTQTAASVLFGIGFPAMTAGFVMMLYGGASSRAKPTLRAAPVVTRDVAGARLQVSF